MGIAKLSNRTSFTKLRFLLIISFSLQLQQTYAASVNNVRTVSSNGGVSSGGRSSAIPVKGCPTSLFMFQTPNGSSSGNFLPLLVGQDFVGDIRLCRFSTYCWGQDDCYAYGFEKFNRCTAVTNPYQEITPSPTYSLQTISRTTAAAPEIDSVVIPPPPLPDFQTSGPRSSRTDSQFQSSNNYEVLHVPKFTNVAWVTQRSFPRFPNMSPLSLSQKLQDGTTAFLARCKITVDGVTDPSIVIRLPGLIFSDSGLSTLSVRYNGISYTCDQDDLEFPVCL